MDIFTGLSDGITGFSWIIHWVKGGLSAKGSAFSNLLQSGIYDSFWFITAPICHKGTLILEHHSSLSTVLGIQKDGDCKCHDQCHTRNDASDIFGYQREIWKIKLFIVEEDIKNECRHTQLETRKSVWDPLTFNIPKPAVSTVIP